MAFIICFFEFLLIFKNEAFSFLGQVLHPNIFFRSLNLFNHFPQLCYDEAPDPERQEIKYDC
jgi:hypothetical protein